MERFVCIHGHFYQPPRENPWLEAVEIQDSAYPYHDWNERISAECYAPNSASRILDGEQRVMDIVSNYAKISFNFGPTLLMWMQNADPDLYQALLAADRQSMAWRAGHGAAIAQVYNHMIMPLANSRDKRSQILWGIRDFEYRFQRFPEGMWLAETAVDLESLDLLAEQGIKFTILAPSQAARFRPLEEEQWREVDGTRIDPTRAYLCRLPSGRQITLFFYDGPISQAVAFENLLSSGENFAGRLLEGFSEERDWPQLLHIATDGESYGHHHKFGDMALASALNYIETNELAQVTNYGQYLEMYPPTHEAQIHENSSWSCFHGVERWRSNCGCNSGGYAAWNQEWRGPLRDALDWLRDRLAVGFEELVAKYLKEPWQARDAYIDVILDRSDQSVDAYFARHAKRQLDENERIRVLKLLEIQRHAMLMYTSCGWFFDELSGIETVQVIQYAGRTLQLAEDLIPGDLEQGFLEKLATAKSNIPEHDNGAVIFEKFVKPAQVDFTKVAVHFAFSSLFKEYAERTRIFSYTVALEDYDQRKVEEVSLATGRVTVTSEITREHDELMFSVVRFGRHDFKGGICHCVVDQVCTDITEEFAAVFEKGYFTEIIALMDRYFGTHSYSLLNLFRDEQREILKHIIDATLERFREDYRSMYEHSRFLMEFVQDTAMPVPKAFLAAAEHCLNADFKEALTADEIDADRVHRIIGHMKRWKVQIDTPDIEIVIRRHLEGWMKDFCREPGNLSRLTRLRNTLALLQEIPLEITLWDIQNMYYRVAKTFYPDLDGDREARDQWLELFRQLGDMLRMNLGAVLPQSGPDAPPAAVDLRAGRTDDRRSGRQGTRHHRGLGKGA